MAAEYRQDREGKSEVMRCIFSKEERRRIEEFVNGPQDTEGVVEGGGGGGVAVRREGSWVEGSFMSFSDNIQLAFEAR